MKKIDIIYEDDWLIAADKPKGVLSEESENGEESLPLLLASHEKNGVKLMPVNRLDRNVSGVTLLAKTKKAAAFLCREVSGIGTYVKEYTAVVLGTLPEKNGEFHDLLFKDSAKNKTFVVSRMRKGVKEASLSYRVMREGFYGDIPVSLVKIRLQTGRTHQIRVQFGSRKHPILGDGKYGDRQSGYDGMALVSSFISFLHPNGKRMELSVNLPSDFPLSDNGTENEKG
ncbi:MAG: RluA family pseudouridine synthase [Clostridia bacterium]|nr:RluA family pseudouridine synthase [Clostridia bacterium]